MAPFRRGWMSRLRNVNPHKKVFITTSFLYQKYIQFLSSAVFVTRFNLYMHMQIIAITIWFDSITITYNCDWVIASDRNFYPFILSRERLILKFRLASCSQLLPVSYEDGLPVNSPLPLVRKGESCLLVCLNCNSSIALVKSNKDSNCPYRCFQYLII